MQKSSSYSQISGTIAAPASKSALQRYIAAALLTDGTTILHGVTFCDDSQAALRLAENLGAQSTLSGTTLKITGGSKPCSSILQCGESGLALRMFAAIAARYDYPIQLTGEQTLLRRPVEMLRTPLQQLGAVCRTTNGCPPLFIQGPLKGGYAEVDGSLSSQFLTGLLLVLPTLANDTRLLVHDLRSRPYVDLTIAILQKCGIKVEHQDYQQFFIDGNQRYRAVETQVEGDWSGAAFLLVAAALQGEVTVTGLDPLSTQADRKILTVLQNCGAIVECTENKVTVRQGELQSFTCDATDCPDLFPPLIALATGSPGVSRIAGVHRLIHKESNRAQALVAEFTRLGIAIRVESDTMLIEGGAIRGGPVEAHQDHRIAMALAVAGLRSQQPVSIAGAECVAKSYPNFFEDLKSIGGKIDE